MNEEEIIKNIKEMIQWSDHNTYKIALRGILDLYEQEKARNKDLEQIEKEHKEENGRLRDRIKELESINAMQEYRINEMDIPRLKVKEIVDLYDNTLQCTRKYNQELADILCDLQELLEESEK